MSDIGAHYDKIFSLLHTNRSHAVHYGFWGKWTLTFAGAQLNENKFLATAAKVEQADRVLDAGCGVGGSALWLAKAFGCRVTGIALGTREIARAQQYTEQQHWGAPVDFHVMDLSKTSFSTGSFTLVWAIESLLYIKEKSLAFQEFFRLLSPNGRVVIADLFLRRLPQEGYEKFIHQHFAQYSKTAQLPTLEEVKGVLHKNGFTSVTYVDKRRAVYITSLFYLLNAVLFLPFTELLSLVSFGHFLPWLRDNVRMGIFQWLGIYSGLFTYGVFLAEKKT